eukprot:249918_1
MALVHLQFLCFIMIILALAAADLPSDAASDVTKQPSKSIVTSIEQTTNLSNQTYQERSDENSQSLIFWVFVITSIIMSLVLVLVRGYSLWSDDKKPDLSNPSAKDTDGDHMVYGDSEAQTEDKTFEITSPKSNITDDIEAFVLRELSEIDASYPGFTRPPRTSSVGYIEAIYARYSGGNEEEMREMRDQDEPKSPTLRIQINGQDVICTKYGVEVTPWSPTPTSRTETAHDGFGVMDEEEDIEIQDVELELYQE